MSLFAFLQSVLSTHIPWGEALSKYSATLPCPSTPPWLPFTFALTDATRRLPFRPMVSLFEEVDLAGQRETSSHLILEEDGVTSRI